MFRIKLHVLIVIACLFTLWASVCFAWSPYDALPFVVFATVFTMALGGVAMESLGRPLNVRQLKKRKLYVIHGQGSFVANGEMKKKVYFVGTRCDKIVAAILPVNLPDNATGFWVTNNYDALGQRIFGEGAILVVPSNEKIPFKWRREAKSKK